MEVSDKAHSDRTEPVQLKEPPERNEEATNHEVQPKAQRIDTKEQKNPRDRPKNDGQYKRIRGSALRKRKRLAKLANFFRRKSDGSSTTPDSSTERIEPIIEPPEPWSASRLRQNIRELVLKRMKLLDAYSGSGRCKRVKKSAKQLTQQNDVDVEDQYGSRLRPTVERRRARKEALAAKRTEEQRSIRLERARSARKLRHGGGINRTATEQQVVQQDSEEEMIDEDYKIDLGDYVILENFYTGNLIPKYSLDEQISTESPTNVGQLPPEDGFADLNLVKVELSLVKVELSLVKVEQDDRIASESAEGLAFPAEWIC